MSIDFEWDVTAAPTDEELISGDSAPNHKPNDWHIRKTANNQSKQKSRLAPGTGRRRWVFAGLGLLALLAGAGLWLFTQTGWQKLTGDVVATINYEEQEATQGATNVVLNVQDRANADWLSVRQDETLARQPAPLPAPGLSFGQTPLQVVDLNAVDSDFVYADVARQFASPGGQSLAFKLPQFYRRGPNNDWLRSAPPGTFWGNWLDWHGTQLIIRYSERDAAFVSQVAPVLDQRLAQACVLWDAGCPSQTPLRLYLSGFVGSLEYDPLANTEVKIELGVAGGGALTPADYFLSVPSPQIAGIPTDAAGQAYLANYLSVRVIAAFAHQLSASNVLYLQRTAQAIRTLGLSGADPGYLAVGQRRRAGPTGILSGDGQRAARVDNGQPGGHDTFSWRVITYTTIPGDTLPGIAAHFNTSVLAIERANHLLNPDELGSGMTLTIPLFAPAPTPSP